MGALNSVVRLDAAVGSTSTSLSYPIGPGPNRCLCVAVAVEGTDPLGNPSVNWGGQSMTQIVAPDVGSPDANKIAMFWMKESKIAAGAGTTLSVSGTAGDVGVSVASYKNCNQTTPSNTDVGENNSSTPVTNVDIITSNTGSLVFTAAACGTSSSATWDADITEQTDINPTGMGASMADAIVSLDGDNIDCNCTWSSQNRAVTAAFEVQRF